MSDIPWGVTRIENLEFQEGFLTADDNNIVVAREQGKGVWKIHPAIGSGSTEPRVLIYKGPHQTEENEYALHLEKAVEGSKIIIHPKNGSKNQQWDITPNDERHFHITSKLDETLRIGINLEQGPNNISVRAVNKDPDTKGKHWHISEPQLREV